MRILPFLAAMALLSFPALARAQSTPVVVELYTSQGCISCPPADELFSELAQQPGVIALALHVDYWDYLGWKDAFGKAEHTQRQRGYAKSIRQRSVFTPQVIVQGAERAIGHDAQAIGGFIQAESAKPAGATLDLRRDGGALVIGIGPRAPQDGASDVHVVTYLPSHDVLIEGGENEGRAFTYLNIVKNWATVASWDGASEVEMTVEGVGADPVAVIVQRDRYGPIIAAARLP